MMWGMTLHPGEEYSRAVSKEEHLTLASLDCRPTMNTDVYRTFAHLVVKVNNCEHVLCYLEKGIIHQQILDFILQEGDNLVLSVEGTGVVHISGYYVSHSRHEDIQQDGSMISAVNAVLDEVLHMDPTISIQNQPETNENDEEENQPDFTDSDINMAGDELPVSDSSHYETFAGANKEENDCQTSNERLKRSGLKTIEKNPDRSLDLLLKCDAGKEQSHSTLTNGVPAKMETLTSLRSTQQPQQSRAAESAASESSITESEETPINRSQYKCTVCEKTFCRQQRKTPMVSEMQRCQSCNTLVRQKDASYKKEATKLNYFQSHSLKNKSVSQFKKESRLKSGTTGKLFKCHLCKKKFSSKRCLNIHKTTHGDTQFLCQFCGEMFTRKQSFLIHERTHISKGPFECQFCPKTFVQKKELILHEQKHQLIKKPLQRYMLQNKILKRKVSQQKRLKTKGRPFQCQFCGKRFTSKSHVLQHERIHTGERPFKCPHCTKTFIQKSHCTQHERTHTGKKQFKCDFCEKRFILKAYVTNHERRCHPGVSPFNCKFCSSRFTTKSQLTQHERVHIDK